MKPTIEIPVYEPDLSGKEREYVLDCIDTAWISSQGSYVERFEKEFANFCGVNHAVAVSNGTAALHLALVVLGIGPGDEVILPTLTFVATANAICYVGATPIFVDSSIETWTIDPKLIEEKITARTKAIIPVHLYGHPADMESILGLAEKHKLYVVEDAAEAHGAECKGKRTGSMGDLSCFSFYGNKIITTGEGGMITTDDDDFAKKARFLKDHAMSADRRYYHPEIGYNYRMTNIQAAIGLAQLERIESTLARKAEIADLYWYYLSRCPGVECHPQAEWAKCVYWMYSILVTAASKLSRNQLAEVLRERGIDTRPFFIPMHQLPPHREKDGDYTIAENLSVRGLNLPSYPSLSNEEIQSICDAIVELSS